MSHGAAEQMSLSKIEMSQWDLGLSKKSLLSYLVADTEGFGGDQIWGDWELHSETRHDSEQTKTLVLHTVLD